MSKQVKFKKKKISQGDFDRKVKVWSIIVPLITCVFTLLTTIGVAYFNRPRVEYRLDSIDRLNLEVISRQMTSLDESYHQTTDPVQKKRIDNELHDLAEQETRIVRKYYPNVSLRFPSDPKDRGNLNDYKNSELEQSPEMSNWMAHLILRSILICLGFFLSRSLIKLILRTIYEGDTARFLTENGYIILGLNRL